MIPARLKHVYSTVYDLVCCKGLDGLHVSAEHCIEAKICLQLLDELEKPEPFSLEAWAAARQVSRQAAPQAILDACSQFCCGQTPAAKHSQLPEQQHPSTQQLAMASFVPDSLAASQCGALQPPSCDAAPADEALPAEGLTEQPCHAARSQFPCEHGTADANDMLRASSRSQNRQAVLHQHENEGLTEQPCHAASSQAQTSISHRPLRLGLRPIITPACKQGAEQVSLQPHQAPASKASADLAEQPELLGRLSEVQEPCAKALIEYRSVMASPEHSRDQSEIQEQQVLGKGQRLALQEVPAWACRPQPLPKSTESRSEQQTFQASKQTWNASEVHGDCFEQQKINIGPCELQQSPSTVSDNADHEDAIAGCDPLPSSQEQPCASRAPTKTGRVPLREGVGWGSRHNRRRCTSCPFPPQSTKQSLSCQM